MIITKEKSIICSPPSAKHRTSFVIIVYLTYLPPIQEWMVESFSVQSTFQFAAKAYFSIAVIEYIAINYVI
jgi:hypothetical protein